ncbi:MAG: glycosyltransferase 87 family protein [Desulfurococcaceae archaeon]
MSALTIRSKLTRARQLVGAYGPVIIANALAIYLSVCCWNPYDVKYFIEWYEEFYAKGRLLEVYSGSEKAAYFPLAILIFVLSHDLAVKISSNPLVWRLIDKMPLIAAFNITYYVLTKRYGRPAGNLWLLTLSAYAILYGYQFDLPISLLILLSIIAIEREKRILYGALVTLAALIKQVTGILLLIPIVELAKKRKYRELAAYIAVSAVLASVFVLPFMLVNPLAFIDKTLFFHAKRPPQYSIWAVPYYVSWYNVDAAPSWFYNLWLVAFALATALIVLMMSREPEYTLKTYLKYMIALTVGFIATTKVNNIPYLTWVSPPLIVLTALSAKENQAGARKLARLFLLAQITIVAIGITHTFPPIVAGYPVFIAEDLSWVPADKVIVDSGGLINIGCYLAIYLRSVSIAKAYFSILASIHNYVLAALCIANVILLVYALREVFKIAVK